MKELITKHQKLLVSICLVIIVLIIAGYAIHATQEQIKHTTYHVQTVKETTPYRGTGKIKSSEVYVKRIPKNERFDSQLSEEQKVKKGQELGVISDPTKEAELRNVQASISSLQTQIQQSQQNQVTTTAEPSVPTSNAPSAPTNSDEENDSDQQQAALAAALMQSQQASMQQTIQQHNDSLQTQLSEQQAKEGELSQQIGSNESAPFDGIFQLKQFKSGAKEIRVYQKNRIMVGQVSQGDYDQLKQSANIKVHNKVTGKTKASKVTFISEIPLKQKGTAKPEYRFTVPVHSSFLYGQLVKFSVPQKGMQIPRTSVNKGTVYIVDSNDEAKQVQVTGRVRGHRFILTSGLKRGDKVITDPNPYLHNGTTVHQKQ